MNGRKWILTVLSLALVLMLAACGGNSPNTNQGNAPETLAPTSGDEEESELFPEPGAKLVVWESKEQLAYMNALAQAFEERYGVPVTIEELAGGDQGARLATDGPSKLAADVLTLPHDQIGQAIKAGLLLPNDVFELETRSSMMEAAITASSMDGVLYGYPKSVETYALFYNKDIFPNAPPATWEEIVQFASTYNDPAQNKYTIMWEFVGYYSYPFIGSYNGYIFGDNNTNPQDLGLNKGDVVQGFEYMKTLKSILPMNAGDVSYDVKTQLFGEGKLALNIDGPWSVSAFKDVVNFGVAPLPKFPNGSEGYSFSGVKSYYVNSYTAYPIAARLFSNFASNKENQLKNYEMTGAIPANIEAGKDPIINDDPVTSGFFKQFEFSVPMPSIAGMNAVWDPLKAAFMTIWDDPNSDVKAILDNMVDTIEQGIVSQ